MSVVAMVSSGEARSPAERTLDLFAGAETRHGTYDPARCRWDGDKFEMKDEKHQGVLDVKSAPTSDLWQRHLDGDRPLGVSPLREDGMCRWGVIDSDDYSLEPADVFDAVEREKLPLVVCRSKSGGAHIFLFADDWVPQATMHAALTACRRRLGIEKGEIFPPEDSRGNWLNMPYFGGDRTDRYGVKRGGVDMSLSEFLRAADAAKVSADDVVWLAAAPADRRRGDRASPEAGRERAQRDLERFVAEVSAAPKGTRSKLLFGRAKDLGKMIGAGWISEAEVSGRLLTAGMVCGLSMSDANGHIRNGIENGRSLPPEDEPDADRYPKIEQIVVHVGGDEPLWTLTLREHGDVTMSVRDASNNRLFNLRCAEQRGVVFRPLKDVPWSDRLAEAMQHKIVVQVEQDETVREQFRQLVRTFCYDRHRGEVCVGEDGRKKYTDLGTSGDHGKPVHDVEANRIYFRLESLRHHVEGGSSIFRGATNTRLGKLMKEHLGTEGIDFGTTTVPMGEEKPPKVRWIRADLFREIPSLPLPPTAIPL